MTVGLLTPSEVANIVKCKPSCVYAWANQGKIPAFKLNGLLRFDSREIEDWVQCHRVQPANIDRQVSKILKSTDKDIDAIIKKAVASVKGKVYNPPRKGNSDQTSP